MAAIPGCYRCLIQHEKIVSCDTVSNICLQCLGSLFQNRQNVTTILENGLAYQKRLPWIWDQNEKCDRCSMYRFVLKVDTCADHHPNPSQRTKLSRSLPKAKL